MSDHIKTWTKRVLDGSQPNGAFARDAEIAELRAALAASPTVGQAAFDAGKAYGELGAAPLPQQAAGDGVSGD